jgi:hypothetical protein
MAVMGTDKEMIESEGWKLLLDSLIISNSSFIYITVAARSEA